MELTKKHIAELIGLIYVEYPREFKDLDQYTLNAKIDLWYSSLRNYPQELIDLVFNKTIKTSTYPPRIADIINGLEELQAINEETDSELWEEFVSAIKRAKKYTYFGMQVYYEDGKKIIPNVEIKKIYNNLNDVLKRYAGGINTFVSLFKQDTLEYEKTRFFKIIPTLKRQEKIKHNTNKNILEMLKNTKLLEF